MKSPKGQLKFQLSLIAPPSDNQNCHATNPKQRAPMSIKIDFSQKGKTFLKKLRCLLLFWGRLWGKGKNLKKI